jgi:hypothetical protein
MRKKINSNDLDWQKYVTILLGKLYNLSEGQAGTTFGKRTFLEEIYFYELKDLDMESIEDIFKYCVDQGWIEVT